MSEGVVAELPSLKPKLEGSRYKRLGRLLKATFPLKNSVLYSGERDLTLSPVTWF